MSGLHGSWSIGSFAGAGVGALAVGAGLDLTPSSSSSARSPCSGLACSHHECSRMRSSPGADERPTTDRAVCLPLVRRNDFARGDRVRGMLCEGASADWASVYLSGPLHAMALCRAWAMLPSRSRWSPCGCRATGCSALQAVTPSSGAGGRGDSRICGRTRDRPPGCRDRGLRLPRNWPGLSGTRRVQRRGPHCGTAPRHGRRDRVGLRLDRFRMRPAIDRSPRVNRLPVSGTRPPALPDRVRGRRHPSVPCIA